MKRRELFWMLLPCIAFAGAALWFHAREQQREQRRAAQNPATPPLRTVGPFSWRVVRIARAALTPREAVLIYGDKWTMDIEGLGAPPPYKSGWHYSGSPPTLKSLSLTERRDGREVLRWAAPAPTFDFSRESIGGESENKRDGVRRLRLTFWLPKVEASGALWLKTDLMPNHNYFPLNAPPNNRPIEVLTGKTQTFTFQVRRPGEKPPVVSRYCPIEIESSKVMRFGPRGTFAFPVEVAVTAHCVDEQMAKERLNWKFETPRVVDDAGHQFPDFVASSGADSGGNTVSRLLFVRLNLTGHTRLENRRGRLWLESAVSVNDCWPRRIKILLRGAPASKATPKP